MGVYHLYALPQVLWLSTTSGAPNMNFPINKTDLHFFPGLSNVVDVFIKDIDRKPVIFLNGSVPYIQLFDPEDQRILGTLPLTLVDQPTSQWRFTVTHASLTDWTPGYVRFNVVVTDPAGVTTPLYTDRNYAPFGQVKIYAQPPVSVPAPVTIDGATLYESWGWSFTSALKGAAAVSNLSGQMTAAITLNQFIGSIEMQGSLASSVPQTDPEWALLTSWSTTTPVTATIPLSYTGNLIWVRFVAKPISIAAGGSVTQIVFRN